MQFEPWREAALRRGRHQTHNGLFDYGACRGGSPHRALGYLQLHYDDGSERRATEVCRDYLALLQRMVADFEVANP